VGDKVIVRVLDTATHTQEFQLGHCLLKYVAK
jgi:hypothetical protein